MENRKETQIAIIGAGISGLATAYWLSKAGFEVVVLEKNDTAGGSMESVRVDGYMFDRGPNSGLETSPLIKTLVEELNLSEEFVYASETGNNRYILRDGKLHSLPMKPLPFLRSKLFSFGGKARILKELFIGKSDDGYNQSLAAFVERRLGKEFLDYMINPFVSGVYAGRPEDLSVRSAFPLLFNLEEKYGGLIKGTLFSIRERKKRAEQSKQSAKMFSFKHGMQTLPKSIAAKLGNRVSFLNDVIEINKIDEGFEIVYNQAGTGVKSMVAKSVISTVPAYVASKIFKTAAPESAAHFDAIYHPPVIVVLAGYKKEQIGQPLDGFGFLIPEKENLSFLGAIWTSVLFPARAPLDSEAFTLFIGGARNPDIFEQDQNARVRQALDEFHKIMKISGEPAFLQQRAWGKAIPQYNVGYIEHERYFDKLEKEMPGLFISGNFRGGISIGDCVKNSELVAKKAMSFIADSGD